MPYNLQGRNWSLPTISRGRDTRELVPAGHHGNRGALTISLPRKLGDSIMAKWANGQDHIRLKLESRASDHSQLILKLAAPTEYGRKFIASRESAGRDYRVFFDPSGYAWIEDIEPFASTITTANLTDEGIVVALPPLEKRQFLAPNAYKARRMPRPTRRQHTLPLIPHDVAEVIERPIEPVHPVATPLYIVAVPPEKDEKFHTMLRFLKLEALKE